MANKVIIITGASRGIGAETALLAAQRGYAVCVNYSSNHEAAMQTVQKAEQFGVSAIAVQADVASEQEVVRLFATTTEKLGTPTALVNNAGVLQTGPIEAVNEDRLRAIFGINVFGAFYCAREAVKCMALDRGGQGGAIVNVSSIAAKLGSPNEYIDYAASKGAIDTMTIGLAKEVAERGIRVNTVRPGVIHTEIHASGGEPDRVERVSHSVPMKRGGNASEVASAIMWLVSDEASYCTGSFLDVSGGR